MSLQTFDLLFCSDKLQPATDRVVTLQCMQCYGRKLFFGTTDGTIIYCIQDETVGDDGKLKFQFKRKLLKNLNSKKPVIEMSVLPIFDRLMVLSAGSISLFNLANLETVSSFTRLKDVITYCVMDNTKSVDFASARVCVAKKGRLLIFSLADDKLTHLKDISISDMPVTMCMDDEFLCYGSLVQYTMVDLRTSDTQQLIPCDPTGLQKPIVQRVSDGEFVLTGPNSLLVFVTIAGVSERPPINCGECIRNVTVSHPYIITMDSDNIAIYGILDQELKQTIPFTQGVSICNQDNRIFVLSDFGAFYALMPVDWQKQVDELLSNGRIDDALQLAASASQEYLDKEQFRRVFRRIQQKAGFAAFTQLDFSKAKQLFIESSLDPRQLIVLFTGLQPVSDSSSSASDRSSAPSCLHKLTTVDEMCYSNSDKITLCKKFLLEYLSDVRFAHFVNDYIEVVICVIVKLISELEPERLTEFLLTCDSDSLKYDVSLPAVLTQNNCAGAMGTYYKIIGKPDLTVKTWRFILEGHYQDNNFGGLSVIVEFLQSLKLDDELLWDNIDFVLNSDEVNGVAVFINRDAKETTIAHHDRVVDRLSGEYKTALLLYLEFIILKLNLTNEPYHTRLATLYTESVLTGIKDSVCESDISRDRLRLRRFLTDSNQYRVHAILGKLDKQELYHEQAILYGKLGDHKRALTMLVHNLQDHEAAIEYCSNAAGLPTAKGKKKEELFTILISIYFDETLPDQKKEQLVAPAIGLLNNHNTTLNAIQVLQTIPEGWAVAALEQFLTHNLSRANHSKKMAAVEKNLRKAWLEQVKLRASGATRDFVTLTERNVCDTCGDRFTSSACKLMPSGAIIHLHCDGR